MDMVFVYDDKIAQDADGNFYTGSAFSQEVFDRYLQHFDHITLLMRKADVDSGDTKTLSRMNRISTEKIDVVILPNTTESMKSFLNPFIHARLKRTILKELKPERGVIVRAPSTCATIAADYCFAHNIPYLAEAVGCPWDSLWNHSLKGKVLAPGIWKDFRRTMRRADYAVYVTSEFLQHRYPTNGKSASISDVELLPLDDYILEKRLKKIREHSGKIRLATAAAVNTAYKGQKYVIEALARLKAQGKTDYEYHLAGGGDASRLRELAERLGVVNQVFFEGSLPHNDMFAWLDEMDLYIQPSLTEGLPRSVVEAMSRGLPALGAYTGGIPELLGKDCIFPRKNAAAIAEMVDRLTCAQMLRMASYNYENAKRFQKELLEKKRYAFYSQFALEAESRRGSSSTGVE